MPMKAAGFSLIEVLVATAIVVGGMAALAPLFMLSGDANRVAAGASISVLAAQQKLEELRAAPDHNASPSGALTEDTAGHVDYLDAEGVPLADSGGGIQAPSGAMFIRRWSVETAGAPVRTIVLRVLVVAANASRERGRGSTVLSSVMVR
jgi:prepilin-type N-terminal cleavage/methylation domain-containing protein